MVMVIIGDEMGLCVCVFICGVEGTGQTSVLKLGGRYGSLLISCYYLQ